MNATIMTSTLKDIHLINGDNTGSILDLEKSPTPLYALSREPLWEIHEFVRRVLSKDSPGFRISTSKNGSKVIEPLALGRKYFKLISHFMARIPSSGTPAGFVGLFFDCCKELHLYFDPFGKPGQYHRPGMTSAELFNTLVDLIRKRARRDPRCSKYLNFKQDYDLVELTSIVDYFDNLFVDYPKILVVRVDLGYAAEEAERITFQRARQHITRFVNNRKWHGFFEHCIGFVIGRERGTSSVEENGGSGRGYHFHCFVLFNGQEVKNDVKLARKIIDYWENRIVNSPRTPQERRIKTWGFNCNLKAKLGGYKYNGIGMVQHSDELKRWHMISSVIYLTKNTQALGDDVPPKTKTLTKGQYMPKKWDPRGRPRQLKVNGETVIVPRQLRHTANAMNCTGTFGS